MSISGRKRLETLCRKHMPSLEYKWDQEFDSANKRRLEPAKDRSGNINYRDGKKVMRTTLGKYMSRRMKIELTPHVEKAVAKVVIDMHGRKKPDIDLSEFEILRGGAVKEAYDSEVGGSSCMTRCYHTTFYTEIPDKVGLLVWQRRRARALIWTCDDGTLLIDKIYSGEPARCLSAYSAWAKANKALCVWQRPKRLKSLKVTVGKVLQEYCDREYKPYFDTLFYIHEGWALSNCKKGALYDAQEAGEPDYIGDMCIFCHSKDDLDKKYGYHFCQECLPLAFRCGICKVIRQGPKTKFGRKNVCSHCEYTRSRNSITMESVLSF